MNEAIILLEAFALLLIAMDQVYYTFVVKYVKEEMKNQKDKNWTEYLIL